MPPTKQATIGAMFDIKPVDSTGRVDVGLLSSFEPQINLRSKNDQAGRLKIQSHVGAPQEITLASLGTAEFSKLQALAELENELNAPGLKKLTLGSIPEAKATLASKPFVPATSKQPVVQDPEHKKILSQIYQRVPVTVPEEFLPPVESVQEPYNYIEPVLASASVALEDDRHQAIQDWYTAPPAASVYRSSGTPRVSKRGWKLFTLILFGAGLIFVGSGWWAKDRLVRQGAMAVENLQSAKTDLEHFDFTSASGHFLSAYEQFSQAGRSLNFMGATISSLIANLPGGNTVSSAQHLVEAGAWAAKTGQAMSDVVGTLAQTSSIIHPDNTTPLSSILSPLRKTLATSKDNLKKITSLLSVVDPTILPEDKRAMFDELMGKLPEFQGLIDRGAAYTDFLERLIGTRGKHTYLVLFQNASELRPTGGFPGSYGLLTFEDGHLKEFMVDDIYDIDGQLKELVVPPRQIQHITPTWAMRDANWFVDFPTSAQKVADFYRKESGNSVDGVLTLNPDIIARILGVVGPIEMPAYSLVLTRDNFLTEVQNEVEYGANKKKNEPKKVISDLTPLLLAKLAGADREKWLEVVNVILTGMTDKDMLMYFGDKKLQQFSLDEGFAGNVKQDPGDFLMATFTNVKGSKADAVTDTALTLDTAVSSQSASHVLTITRQHNGGKSQYGFYNKQNSSFVRVLVPQGAQLASITGNTKTSFQPLVDYNQGGFVRDKDLEQFEKSGVYDDATGAWVLQESGKTEFGFWMNVDPGTTGTVKLAYAVKDGISNPYTLYVQKQPGLDVKSFTWNLLPSDSLAIIDSSLPFHRNGKRYSFTSSLEQDLPLKVRFR